MAIGDVTTVSATGCTDVHYVDTGMYEVPEYGSVYLIDGDRPALIDAGIGADREQVFALLDAVGVAREALEVIALTHVHLDHAGGAGYLVESCPNATVHVHERGARHLVAPDRLVAGTKAAVGEQWQYYDEPRPVPEARLRRVSDGDRIELGDHTLIARAVPGHAPHQVAYDAPEDDAVFTGDAAGIYVPTLDRVVPTSPPPQFDYPQALADVHTLAGLDRSTLLYAHFGPAPVARLAAFTHSLAEWITDVAEARARILARADDPPEGTTLAAAIVDRVVDEPPVVGVWGEEKTRAEIELNVRGVLKYLERREADHGFRAPPT